MQKNITFIGQVTVSMLTLLWIYAAISKLGNPHTTILQMQKQPLPPWSTKVLAAGIPVVELGIAILLNVHKTRFMGLAASTALLSLFSLYIICVLLSLSRQNIPCSCGGIIGQLGWKAHLFFNLFWLALCIVGMLNHKRSTTVVANIFSGSPAQT